jgi:hypothetical protein
MTRGAASDSQGGTPSASLTSMPAADGALQGRFAGARFRRQERHWQRVGLVALIARRHLDRGTHAGPALLGTLEVSVHGPGLAPRNGFRRSPLPRRRNQPLTPTRVPNPAFPKSPEEPVVPPDDPNKPYVDREPSIDPPPLEPPLEAPSEQPQVQEPPAPRANQLDGEPMAPRLLSDRSGSLEWRRCEVHGRLAPRRPVRAHRAVVRRQSGRLRPVAITPVEIIW